MSSASASESDSSLLPLPLDGFYGVVAADLRPTLHLDATRLAFLRDATRTLHAMAVKKSLKNRTGYRRLLVGRKGVGKSALLHGLLEAAHRHLAKYGLLCLYISYENAKDAPLAEVIARQLSLPGPDAYAAIDIANESKSEWTIDRIERWLADNGNSLFIGVDEFHCAYTSAYTHGKAIIRDVMAIGSSRSGLIHCILSGTSTVMRRLCFSAMAPEEARALGYSNYVLGFDLNSSKFTPLWIDAFLAAEDFRAAARMIQHPDIDPLPDDAQMAKAYLHTGGNTRLMETALRPNTCISNTAHPSIMLSSMRETVKSDQLESARMLLSAIFRCVSVYRLGAIPANGTELDYVASYTMMVDRNMVMSMVGDTQENRSLLFDLADAGVIHFDDLSSNMIGLGHAGIYVELIDQSAFVLTISHAFAMMVPVGDRQGALAEDVTMRCLVFGANQLLGISQSLKGTRELLLGTELDAPTPSISASPPLMSPSASSHTAKVIPEPKLAVDYHQATAEKLLDYVWKESYKKSGSNSAKLGADAVIFQTVTDDDGSPAMVAHRIQIQLGTGPGPAEQVQDVKAAIARFTTMSGETSNVYKRSFHNKPIRIRNYILATRGRGFATISTEQIHPLLQAADIKLLGAKDLREKLWPAAVRALGPPY